MKRPRKIQIPATTRPTRAASHSNLLDADPPRRTRRYSDGSDNRDDDRYRPRARSNTPDRNGHGNTIPLMSSGYKRLPYQDVPEKPIRTTLLKKKITDGKTSQSRERCGMNYWFLMGFFFFLLLQSMDWSWAVRSSSSTWRKQAWLQRRELCRRETSFSRWTWGLGWLI